MKTPHEIATGAMPETPRYDVTLKHDSGRYTVRIAAESRSWDDPMISDVCGFDGPLRNGSDIAIARICKMERAPFSAFVSVYVANPVPAVSGRYGAPMGRPSDAMDHDAPPAIRRASRVPLNSGGYDRGGAYWGTRPRGLHLYAVQDGMGNLAFVDAATSQEAISKAWES